MEILNKTQSIMGMSQEVWLRHSNPWSVYTRMFTTLPLLSIAIWSREWIGWWSLAATALVLAWIWLNPRIFPKPRSTSNWASKGTFGERLYLKRDEFPIPDHHLYMAKILVGLSLSGVFVLGYGLYFLEIWPTLFGNFLIAVPKIWFVDRMVWLYEDISRVNSEVKSWEY